LFNRLTRLESRRQVKKSSTVCVENADTYYSTTAAASSTV